MFRLRGAAGAVAAVALAASGVGCSVFWDNAHEFPVPGRFAAMPGSYSGPPLRGDAGRGEGDAYSPPAAATATRESAMTVAPNAPQSDGGVGVPVLPPPPGSTAPAPFTSPAY